MTVEYQKCEIKIQRGLISYHSTGKREFLDTCVSDSTSHFINWSVSWPVGANLLL